MGRKRDKELERERGRQVGVMRESLPCETKGGGALEMPTNFCKLREFYTAS